MITMRKTISFDTSLKSEILNAFGKKIDDEGYIVDKKSKERVLSPDGEKLLNTDFGGITKGSEIYLRSDIISLINYIERLQ